MNIIGISAQAGSGKDTVADMLLAKEGFVKVSLADPLKRFTGDLWGFSKEQLFGSSEYRNKPDKRYPITTPSGEVGYLIPRRVFQHVGTEGCRYLDPDVWVRYLARVAETLLTTEGDYCYSEEGGLQDYISCYPQGDFKTIEDFPSKVKAIVVSDVRFENEIRFIREVGGKLIRIKRPGAGLSGELGEHQSEVEMDSVPDDYFDLVIHNTGTLEDLHRIIDEFSESL